jgi:hypothetical protein
MHYETDKRGKGDPMFIPTIKSLDLSPCVINQYTIQLLNAADLSDLKFSLVKCWNTTQRTK